MYADILLDTLVTVCVFDEGHITEMYSIRILTVEDWSTVNTLQDVMNIDAESDRVKLDTYMNQIGIAKSLYTLSFDRHHDILVPFPLQVTAPEYNIQREVENTGQILITGQ